MDSMAAFKPSRELATPGTSFKVDMPSAPEARIQLGGSFRCRKELEEELIWPKGGLSAIAEDALATCLTSKQAASGSVTTVIHVYHQINYN